MINLMSQSVNLMFSSVKGGKNMKKHTVLKVSVNLFKILYIKKVQILLSCNKKRELIIHTMNSSLKMIKIIHV